MATAPWVRTISRQLKEVRIHLCQTSKSSQGVRDFIEKYYVDLKQQNPTFPFLVRECSGVEPKLYGRYSEGVEASVSLVNKNKDEVLAALEKMTTTER